MEEKIKKALDKVRPMLQADGGDAAFVAWNDETGVLQVQLLGMCAGCPMSQFTLKEGIEKTIKEAIPEVKEVIQV